MRRDAKVFAAALAGLFAWSCTGRPAPTPPPSSGPPCFELAKVVVTLTPGGQKKCKAAVNARSVCVFQGGAVSWRILNNCEDLGGTTGPAFEIANVKDTSTGQPPLWEFEGCSLKLPEVPRASGGRGELLLCGVPDDATKGLYKYDVQGADIETLDPDIEVRKRN